MHTTLKFFVWLVNNLLTSKCSDLKTVCKLWYGIFFWLWNLVMCYLWCVISVCLTYGVTWVKISQKNQSLLRDRSIYYGKVEESFLVFKLNVKIRALEWNGIWQNKDSENNRPGVVNYMQLLKICVSFTTHFSIATESHHLYTTPSTCQISRSDWWAQLVDELLCSPSEQMQWLPQTSPCV